MANSRSYPFQFIVEDDILIKYEGYDNEIEIPEGILAIENKAFWYNKFLTKITLPTTLKAIGNYAFCGCAALSEINIPSGVRHIGKMAFNGCSKLTELDLPDSVEEIGAQAFGNCANLSAVTLAAVKKLPQCVFANCKSLDYLQIPEGVEEIGDAALAGCDSLETVVIPGTVESIGEAAVEGCDKLDEIHYIGTKEEFDDIDTADDFEEDTEDVNIEFTEETPTPAPTPKAPTYTSTAKNNPNGVKIGDKVVVSDSGQRYASYTAWFDDNAPEFKSRFTSSSLEDGEYTVVAMGMHSTGSDTLCCAIESASKKIYLIGATGLKAPAVAAALADFKVGDTVIVSDDMQRYSTYTNWFDKYAPELKSGYAMNQPIPEGTFTLVRMEQHTSDKTCYVCCLKHNATGKYFLLDKKGVEKAPASATPASTPAKKPVYVSNSKNNPSGIEIGDTVTVSNSGQRYPSYVSWFDLCAPELKARFVKDKDLVGGTYKVLTMGMHTPISDTLCCVIESTSTKDIFLIGATGLSKATSTPPTASASYTSNSTNNPTGVQLGDTVLVTDSGKRYPSYSSWFDTNAPHLKSRFEDKPLSTSTKYKVLAMGMHSAGSNTLCCAIEAEGGGTVHLIGANGLKRFAPAANYVSNSSNNPLGLKIGDSVQVSDAGKQYSSYTTWLTNHAPTYLMKFENNKKVDTSATYKIVAMGNHSAGNDTLLCAIDGGLRVFIMGALGLKRAVEFTAPTYTSNSSNNPGGVAVGDTVEISNAGQQYSSYVSWFDKNAPHLKSRFAAEESIPTSAKYKILAIGYHGVGDTLVCAVESTSTSKLYLIGATGVRKASATATTPSNVISNSTNNPNDVKVGDTVIVYDSGKRYSSYSTWFTNNAPHLASRFAKDKPLPSGTFTILAMAYHSAGSTTICCAIENTSDKSVHLIGAAGLKKSSVTQSYSTSSDLNPGDTVVVTDVMQRYPTYRGWFDAYAPEWASGFAYDEQIPSGTFTLMKMAPHTGDKSVYVCCLKHNVNGKYYLVQRKGVAKASGSAPTYTSNSTNNPTGVKVGDTVVVSDSGQRYPSYASWFTTNAPHLASRFIKDKSLVGGNYTVLAMGPHTAGSDTICCAIESQSDRSLYLVGARGLSKVGSSSGSFAGASFGNISNNPNGLRIGDTVVVVNSGKQYTTYSSWFDANAPHLKSSFAYSSSISTYGRYTIVAAAPHSAGNRDTIVCAVKSVSDGKVYLIGALGIKRA